MQEASFLKVATHRGSPRVWIEGRRAGRAGFVPNATYEISKNRNGVVLRLSDSGRVVCQKNKKGRVIPIIDLHGDKVLSEMRGAEVVKVVYREREIVISRVASQERTIQRLKRLRQKLANSQPLDVGGIAAGAGVLTHTAHEGFEEAGISVKVKFHNEIRADLCDVAMNNNGALDSETVILNMPIQELAFDDAVLEEIGSVDILELGLPCSGASRSGASKLGLSMAEEHPNVGHLVVGALALVAKLNPVCCVFENVPAYQKTASAILIRQQLKDMGYSIHERLLYGPDFGSLEKRNRWCLVAMTSGIDFNIESIPTRPQAVSQIGELFDPPHLVEDRWSAMHGLKAKQARDVMAGKGFRMQVYSGSESHINTLTKGIAKNRSTDPKIQHPLNPELLRVPTAREHARYKGILVDLIDSIPETMAHELLGQSITTGPFRALFKHIGDSLLAWGGELYSSSGQLNLKFAA